MAAIATLTTVMLLGFDADSGVLSANHGQGSTPGHVASVASPDMFNAHWNDGNGEVNTYAVVQSRYGELRSGESELVFVTEEISRDSRIKIESDSVPRDHRLPVLKLNRVVRFQTGVYDYAVMTSTFAALSSEMGLHPLSALKISATINEWCGNYFAMVLSDPRGMRYTRHSYFESEGDVESAPIAYPAGDWEYEDNLPILIRELRGAWMNDGETRAIGLWPTVQHQRFLHTAHGFVAATITKHSGGAVKVAGRTYPATTQWIWKYHDASGEVEETYLTDTAYPHAILSWKSSDGSSGTLLASRRIPYWTRHDNASAPLRRELGLREMGM